MEAVNQLINLHQVAEITLGYHPKIKSSQRPKVGCSRQVYEVLYNFWDKEFVQFPKVGQPELW